MSAGEQTAPVAAGSREHVPSSGPSGTVSWIRLLRSEMRLILGRRRNQVGLLVLASVPVLLTIAVKLSSPRPGRGPTFLSSITDNGLFVALAALTVEIAMFLPFSVALLAGDSIAGEANLGTLRYLLTIPVGRTRLLLVKYASLAAGALLGVLAVAVTGVVVGSVVFGAGPLTTLSGTQLALPSALWRLLLVSLYLAAGLAALGAVGLFVSTLTEQPIAAAAAVMVLAILAWILDGIPQLEWLHPWLLVHEWLSFGDLLRDPVELGNVTRGLLVDAAYAVVFWLAAWARFAGKDVTS